MAGLLSTIRANCLAKSLTLPYFTPLAEDPPDAVTKPITFYTEKLKSIEQLVNDTISRLGLSVMIATIVANDLQNQKEGLFFNDIAVVFRVLENPKINATGVEASDCAEAILALFKGFEAFPGKFLRGLGAQLGSDPNPNVLVYDVLFSISAGTTTAPARS